MTNEQKKQLLLDLIKIEENGEIFNFTRAERAEFQKWVDGLIDQESRCIPVSERLPNDRDWYLGIFKEPDTGWINPLPFICDYVGRETKATTKEYWILRGFTDMDEHMDYYFNLECIKWMPLPKPYKAESEEEDEKDT